MEYEATIVFEVEDKKVDMMELVRELARRFPEILSLGLVGRTEEGEVVREMEMGRGGTVDWTDEAKVRIGQATKEIARRLEVDEETSNVLWEGMSTSTSSWRAKACVPTPAVSSRCASFPRHWSSSEAELLLCLNRRTDALAHPQQRG
jgi:hypothetical protein